MSSSIQQAHLHQQQSTGQEEQTQQQHMIRRTYSDAIRALNSLQSNYATVEAARKTATANKQSMIQRNSMLMPEMIEWTRRIGIEPVDLNKLNIIHVTGTKGKGSTCAFIQSILSQYKNIPIKPINTDNTTTTTSTTTATTTTTNLFNGITKIGLYTSPHLKSVRERIMLNGKPISEELFTKYFYEVWDKLDTSSSDTSIFPHMGLGSKPAYFRFLTLLSFHTFLKENVNTAIYEVGVGGEYDSTNVFIQPTCCGITSIGIDHTIMLGNTYEEIAWNKSGIFKPNSDAFTVEQANDSVMEVISNRAKERNVSSFNIVKTRNDLNDIELGLKGEFQKQNASLAISLCAQHLAKLGYENIDITNDLPVEFIKGLTTAQWAGRCQTIIDTKRQDISWFIDGAHTKESIQNGSQWFTTVTKQNHKKVLLFNQQTRDVESLISELYKVMSNSEISFDHVIFTTNITWSSGYSEDLKSINTSSEQVDSLEVQKKLAEIWSKIEEDKKMKSRKHIFHDIETSVNFIRTLEGTLDVFVCGSLHLVGGFLVVLDGKKD